jgi:hypothetical protein
MSGLPPIDGYAGAVVVYGLSQFQFYALTSAD